MTKSSFVQEFKMTLDKMFNIMEKKNHDYGGDTDPFNNFRMAESLGICSVEQAILVRMTDKLSRITTLISKEAKVNDESIEDTLVDLANYSIILKTYLLSKKQEELDLPF